MRNTSNYYVNRDIGLPALTLKQARMNKAADTIRNRTLYKSMCLSSESDERTIKYVKKLSRDDGSAERA